MADLSNNSFIPKRGPAKRKRKSASKQVYLFTLVSYVTMFATLLGSGGLFLYTFFLEQQRAEELTALDTAIKRFDEADMKEVVDFDRRLDQASGRLNNSISMISVFNALEEATAKTIRIDTLDLEREGDENLLLTASIKTDSFDSTIFQRGIYEDYDIISPIALLNVQTSNEVETDEDEDGEEESSFEEVSASEIKTVFFTAELGIAVSDVPYEVREELNQEPTPTPLFGESLEETGSTTDDAIEVNEESI